ncbi:MAG: lambda exonuclease family protein [Pseudomonadota bacterium]|jgi:putative phage-type endonuclease
MIIHDVEQGSAEWHALRAGIPTASEFDKILSPTGKKSAQAEGYANRLLAELIVGGSVETWEGNVWTERGKELEQEAADFYEMSKGVTLKKVGFITDNERTMGASPDRLIEGGGLLEIKCPSPHVHVAYLLKGEVDQGYNSQLQGQMLVTGEAWVDIVSYHPQMPPVIMRVKRDESYIKSLREALDEFTATIEKKKASLIEAGHLTKEEA